MKTSKGEKIIDEQTGEEIVIDIDIEKIEKVKEEDVQIISDGLDTTSKHFKNKVEPNISKITTWKAKGFRDSDIAELLDIASSTFGRYKREYKPIRDAYEEGMNSLLDDIELSMYRESMGYDYEETVVNNKTGEIVRISKHARANPTFAKFVLKNRRGETWKEKTEIEKRNIIEADFSALQNLTTEEIRGFLNSTPEEETIEEQNE